MQHEHDRMIRRALKMSDGTDGTLKERIPWHIVKYVERAEELMRNISNQGIFTRLELAMLVLQAEQVQKIRDHLKMPPDIDPRVVPEQKKEPEKKPAK